MKRLKITHEIISPFKELLVNEINGTFSFNPQNRNGEELSDFLSTCELLPSVSELVQQRDELLKALNIANAMITHVGCVQGCNKGTTHDGEQCQWCDESSLIKNTIDKIKIQLLTTISSKATEQR